MPFQLLQAAPQSPAQSFGPFIQMALILGVFYVVLFLPMRKQQKKTKEMLSALKKGDRVVTTGGIYGQVASVEDQVVWVKIADTVKVKMARSAITGIVTESGDAKESTGA